MKIIFTTLKFKNFLSTGNDFTEIQLDKNNCTVIVGMNGAGKTTIIDALTFALFGTAFRNINKPKLVNTINKENCVVELSFKIGRKSYLIRRGIKPNLFEIYCKGKLINQDAGIKDYQTYLEKNILQFNFKSFSQVIVLGSKTYVPFMRLPAADRRSVVENILDIQIFSLMMKNIKTKIDENEKDLAKNLKELELSKERVRLQKKLLNELEAKNQEKIDSNLENIKDSEKQIKDYQDEIKIYQNHLDKIITEDTTDSINCKISETIGLISKITQNNTNAKKSILFFEHNETCPTCDQEIKEDFRENQIKTKQEKTLTYDHALNDLNSKLEKLKLKLKEINKEKEEQKSILYSIKNLEDSIKTHSSWIKKLTNENFDIKNNPNDIGKNTEILVSYEKQLCVNNKTNNDLKEKEKYLENCVQLLKDGGIKSSIIKKYIPKINNSINKYLSFMDFFVNFNLNEQFEETIYSRFRDEFSYENFSDGEKLRLDLAILFAWRSISKLKNSIDTNLLIMDEILDSSLDSNGIDDFFKLIDSLQSNDTNMFIISHKTDIMTDKFSNVLKFVKRNNFSELEE